MTEPVTEAGAPEVEVASDDLRKEAFTMALYVSVCLLAASAAIAESDRSHVEVLGLVWGTTIGLALAHLFAFRVSARLVGSGSVQQRDLQTALAQLVGAMAVAAVCTVPVLVFPTSAELDVVRWLLAGFIALVAYLTARSGGTPRHRALIYGCWVLVVALVIVVIKNVLAGH